MPEVEITDVSRALRDLYEKGKAAFAKNNFDYAIALFDQVLRKEPGFYACREALRASQFARARKGSSFLKKFFGSANPLFAKAQVQLRAHPIEAVQTVEQILNKDPQNNSAHKLLAEAALAADLPKTAVLSLEIVFKKNPDDRNNALKLGHALGKVGRSEKGEQILAALREAYPHDAEIAKALKNFTARRTLDEGGYEKLSSGEGSYRDILKDKQEAISLEQENREVKTEEVAERLISDYEARLAEDPGNLNFLRKLGDLHVQKADFDKGLEYYEQIASAAGGDEPALRRVIVQTQLKKMDHEIARLDATAPDYPEKLDRLTRERRNFQLEECKQRSERFPNDLEIRFELGQLYFETEQFSEAIKQFQKSQSHPHLRIRSLNFLGQCFARRGIHDLAVKTFRTAIEAKELFDEEKKELLYELGCALEQLGKPDEAIEAFKEIYAADIDYRDVAQKVDAYYTGRE